MWNVKRSKIQLNINRNNFFQVSFVLTKANTTNSTPSSTPNPTHHSEEHWLPWFLHLNFTLSATQIVYYIHVWQTRDDGSFLSQLRADRKQEEADAPEQRTGEDKRQISAL